MQLTLPFLVQQIVSKEYFFSLSLRLYITFSEGTGRNNTLKQPEISAHPARQLGNLMLMGLITLLVICDGVINLNIFG